MSGLSSIIHYSAKSEPLSIELIYWPPLCLLLVIMHWLAAAGIVFSALPLFLQLLLLLFLPLSFYYYAQRLPAASSVAVSALQWRDNTCDVSQWQLRINQRWFKADIAELVIWADWVFLRFCLDGKTVPVNLLLCRKHCASQAAWCGLRRQLQMVEL